ncbi:MBL fold metallo-hydrolase [Flavihumibacter solisilvae]|uniref:Beta-lactamase n=1 Tax=Flavihumibacter solisilvae TaxID=1349421 RepID=A0A0C1LFA4_9BACT|nr:MBL fold metallo-hydrolase [Flavihumibacter solisilvae]KIC94008.1 beta-lactamase [Flavihumibacter solisilvae]
MKLCTLLVLLLFNGFTALAQTDIIETNKGPLEIHPVLHGSLWLKWNNIKIAVDPYGGATRFTEMGEADLVIITDIHGDHLDSSTLAAMNLGKAKLIVPAAVAERLKVVLPSFKNIEVLANGAQTSFKDITITALPMYNLPETADSRHPKGRGNGYLLNIAGKQVYFSGDTEDIPEMRALKNVDVAFVCMNLPYTMDEKQAASAVLEFKPKIVYPYHYRKPDGFTDVKEFARMVNEKDKAIDVRLRNWYPG